MDALTSISVYCLVVNIFEKLTLSLKENKKSSTPVVKSVYIHCKEGESHHIFSSSF